MCRYLVGLSASRLKAHNVSNQLTRLLNWRLEVLQPRQLELSRGRGGWGLEVNYAPDKLTPRRVEELLAATRGEYEALKAELNFSGFHEIIRHFQPSFEVVGHPVRSIVYQAFFLFASTPLHPVTLAGFSKISTSTRTRRWRRTCSSPTLRTCTSTTPSATASRHPPTPFLPFILPS